MAIPGPKRQLTLPTNPNGVVFTTSAQDLLARRDWPAVCRLSSHGLTEFHRASGLPGVSGFSWRTRTDRKNRQIADLLMVFVFDGPASAADLEVLERAVQQASVSWSIAHVERVPQRLAWAVMIRDDALSHMWEGTAEEPVFKDLVWSQGSVLLRERSADQCGPDDFIPAIEHVRVVPPRFEDHDADLERMRLVYAQHFVRRIVEADGRIRDEEVVFLDAVFPGHLMRRLEVGDAAASEEWFERAMKELPTRLGHHDKLAMIGLFFSACYSDGNLDAREMRVLRQAGEALGLSRHEVARYLERFW